MPPLASCAPEACNVGAQVPGGAACTLHLDDVEAVESEDGEQELVLSEEVEESEGDELFEQELDARRSEQAVKSPSEQAAGSPSRTLGAAD